MTSKSIAAGWLVAGVCLTVFVGATLGGEFRFRAQELETKLGVGYAVRLIDMNGDGKKDICVVDKTRILWMENPRWNEHVILEGQTKPDNVCFAPQDIDGDGKLDFAIGADWRFTSPTAGTIGWIKQNASATQPFTLYEIGEEPFVHRMRWTDLDRDGKPELIVAPLLGAGKSQPERISKPIRLLAYRIPDDPAKGRWYPEVISDELTVAHNFWPTDLNRDGRMDILVASYEGVSLLERQSSGDWKRTLIGTGNQDQKVLDRRGASEIRHGRLASGGDYIATIEPWHGNQVVVYTRPDGGQPLWRRQVLDDQLKWGHAVWCADLDGDADEELIIGVRDNRDANARSGVRIFDPQDKTGDEWHRTLVDPGGVAVEDLAAADLNADGQADIVAVGRATHNIRVYWNETGRAGQ